MKRFLTNLFRGFRTSTARSTVLSSKRVLLQTNPLEDRTVLSSAGLSGVNDSVLTISASAGSVGHTRYITLEELNPTGNRQIEVFDSVQGNIGDFFINPLTKININVSNLDQVDIDDSSGMPFATGSTISFSGSGGNSVQFGGSRAIAGNEYYYAGTAQNPESEMQEDGLTFQFDKSITTIGDFIAITGSLNVTTFSPSVLLTSTSYSDVQTLSNLGPGANILTYAQKPFVTVNEFGANANVILDATTSTGGEHQFIAKLWGTGETAIVATTPNSGMQTVVDAIGSQATEELQRNSSLVFLEGNSSTTTFVGLPVGNGQESLRGIDADVSVVGAGLLLVENNGNHTLAEDVTVTESSISGVGLFGNNAAEVTFNGVSTVSILSGAAADTYNIEGTTPGQNIPQINIFDDSAVSFSATVDVNSMSRMNVQLFNESTNPHARASLTIDAVGGHFSNPHPQPGNGSEDVTFSNGNSDAVAYFGFTSIKLEEV
jgi:hypothetical protein